MPQYSETVYLVDDDSRVRRALTSLLESHGFKVVSFGSASEFLSYTRSVDISCLILDLHLPDGSGLELQRQLSSAVTPPIIFISGKGDIPTSVRAIKAGAIEFLTKPVDGDALITSVRTALRLDRESREENVERTKLRQRYDSLTPREAEVLPYVGEGMPNKQVAATLGIAEVTVEVHRGQIMRKMQAKSFADLIRMACKLGIPYKQ